VPQTVDALEAFARNLRFPRVERGLTQERLAELADLHMTDVGRIERGERDPGLRTAAKLATGLGIALADLLREPP
jgi:transcriptional regulator with XRE-family HTH domain